MVPFHPWFKFYFPLFQLFIVFIFLCAVAGTVLPFITENSQLTPLLERFVFN